MPEKIHLKIPISKWGFKADIQQNLQTDIFKGFKNLLGFFFFFFFFEPTFCQTHLTSEIRFTVCKKAEIFEEILSMPNHKEFGKKACEHELQQHLED